jgi:glycolate oxidase iron-sulfur subunit
MSVCPVYKATLREADVARGRLALLESVELDTIKWSERLEEILSRCILCGACAEVCASNVDTTHLIQQGRQRLFEVGKGTRWAKRAIGGVRAAGLSGKVLLKGGALLAALACKKIPESSGLHLRFPMSFFTNRATVPPVAWTSFIKGFRPQPDTPGTGLRIGFFVGCGANYLFPDTALALVHILRHMGATVLVPKGQACCGLPAYVSGDINTARALARKNLEAFGALGLDHVVTVCASCGSHLNNLEALFKHDAQWRDAARSLGEDHMDAMAFLVERLGFDSHLKRLELAANHIGRQPLITAYHDPCHLRIGQGVLEAPRRLLQATPGLDLAEVPHNGQCCGHGGDFNLSHFDLSLRILDQRMGDFEVVKPEAIVTGCTGCLLQLAEGVARNRLAGRVKVCHPLVLVSKAIGREFP